MEMGPDFPTELKIKRIEDDFPRLDQTVVTDSSGLGHPFVLVSVLVP